MVKEYAALNMFTGESYVQSFQSSPNFDKLFRIRFNIIACSCARLIIQSRVVPGNSRPILCEHIYCHACCMSCLLGYITLTVLHADWSSLLCISLSLFLLILYSKYLYDVASLHTHTHTQANRNGLLWMYTVELKDWIQGVVQYILNVGNLWCLISWF